MPMPYKNGPEYWLKELDRQEKRVPAVGRRLAGPVPRASSGWNPLTNKADKTRSPGRLAGFAESRLTTPQTMPAVQPRSQTQAGQAGEGWKGATPPQWAINAYEPGVVIRGGDVYRKFMHGPLEGYEYLEEGGGGPMSLASARERIGGQERPGFVDVPRGGGTRKFLAGELAGREYKLGELGPTPEQVGRQYAPSSESPGGIKRISTKEDIEKSRAQTEYKLAQYDLMASQYMAPFMTTTTNAEGAPVRTRSEEGSRLYDKYAKMFLTDPEKAESLLKDEAEGVAVKAAKAKQLEAMSPEELERFIAAEEAVARPEAAASITEAAEAGPERPGPFALSLSGIAKKREQEEGARRKRLYGEYTEEGPLAAPRRRLVDWLNRPARRAY